MASRNVNVQETWTVEPELMEAPPRRVVPSDAPDLNQPKAALFYGLAGGLCLVGLVLLILGMAGEAVNILLVIGGVILIAAAVGVGYTFPQLLTRYQERAERLTTFGLPVMARIISSDNLSGDNQYARLVRYQVSMPGGELVYRHVRADDRLLPKQIPGSATALVDVGTNEVELYCALPFRVLPKTGAGSQSAAVDPLHGLPVAPQPAQTAPTGMHTLNVEAPRPPRPQKSPAPAPAPAPATAPTAPEPQATPAPAPGAMASLGPAPLVTPAEATETPEVPRLERRPVQKQEHSHALPTGNEATPPFEDEPPVAPAARATGNGSGLPQLTPMAKSAPVIAPAEPSEPVEGEVEPAPAGQPARLAELTPMPAAPESETAPVEAAPAETGEPVKPKTSRRRKKTTESADTADTAATDTAAAAATADTAGEAKQKDEPASGLPWE